MGGYFQIWIRLPEDYLNLKMLSGFLARIERTAESLRKPICDCPPIDLVISEEWLAIEHPLGTTREAGPLLKVITEETQLDALYYTGSTTSGTWAYCRWHAGKQVRAFELNLFDQSFDTRIWSVVEGEPEPWERELFFPQRHFGYWLHDGIERTEAEKLALQEYWQAGRLIKDKRERTVGMAIGELFWQIVERNNLPNTRSVWDRPEGLRGT